MEVLNDLAEGIDLIPKGHQINKPQHIFKRIPNEVVEAQVKKLEIAAEAIKKANQGANYQPLKENITFDDFQKIDLRTGTILTAEKMKKSKKLLKLTVDLGFEKRTIVSGIAEFYKAEAVVGQQVVVVANLAPKKLRGVESQGMILMAENEEGRLAFVSPENGFGNGWVVK